jgi:exopolyphosphatase
MPMEATRKSARLSSYLETAREAVQKGETLRFVIGNESADLDSMASAVAYGYYATVASGHGAAPCAPLVNIPRADYKLRTEATFLFSAVGIQPEMLTFVDEVGLSALAGRNELLLTLVDHNVLAASQQELARSVAGVVDHHQDEGGFVEARPRIVEPVGSACTLVGELLLSNCPEAVEPGLAELLLGTILLDTVNLDPEAKRATDKDHAVAARLQAICGAEPKALFDRLQFEKFNVASLDTPDLLRKDYKQYQMGPVRCGMASVLLPVSRWLEKDPGLAESMATFAARNGLDVLLAMNAYTDPEFRRELVVWAATPALRARMLGFLAASDLGLSPLGAAREVENAGVAMFAQANAAYSRKKLQPLIQQFFG